MSAPISCIRIHGIHYGAIHKPYLIFQGVEALQLKNEVDGGLHFLRLV